jgi:hypothetical protein
MELISSRTLQVNGIMGIVMIYFCYVFQVLFDLFLLSCFIIFSNLVHHDLFEGRPHGKLMSFDPKTRQTKVLARNLYFANGVTLSADESFLLICETYDFRVDRYWFDLISFFLYLNN